MDVIIEVAEKFGLMAVTAGAAFWYINKNNNFLQIELQKEMRESFSRLEGIVIQLINNSKTERENNKQAFLLIEKENEIIIDIISKLNTTMNGDLKREIETLKSSIKEHKKGWFK
tara:strand:- start:916 stop:1260 length:345 start_codon:yes stop_codon:yes gene_type:complete